MNNKKIVALILLLLLLLTLLPLPTAAAPSSSWARDGINEFFAKGFMPEAFVLYDYTDDLTRLDFCVLIVRVYRTLAQSPVTPDYWAQPFDDIDDYDVNYAYQLGIVNGTGSRQFSPERTITRQEIARMFHNLMGALGVAEAYSAQAQLTALAAYNDLKSIHSWAYEGVAAMTALGIMEGSGSNFMPTANASYEQIMLMVNRCAARCYDDFSYPTVPVITSPQSGLDVGNGFFTMTWEYEYAGSSEFTIYGYNWRDSELSFVHRVYNMSAFTFYKGDLKQGDTYWLMVSVDGMVSQPIVVQAGEKTPAITAKFIGGSADGESFYLGSEGVNKPVTFTWDAIPNAASYRVSMLMERQSTRPENIPKNTPIVTTTTLCEYTLDEARPIKDYTITVTALDAAQNELAMLTICMTTGPVYSLAEKRAMIYYDDSVTDETIRAEAVEVVVPVWKINSNGEKYQSKAYIEVNKVLAQMTIDIFNEIFNGPEQFPIYSVGGMRNSSGEHYRGTAIDMNPNENYCIYTSGTVVGKYWKPYEDVYSITPYGDVVTAFERRGFTWGGDYWYSTIDYMHFSFLET